MKAIKAILSFCITVLKSSPVLTESKNGFMIYNPISQSDFAKLERLCEKADWMCKTFPEAYTIDKTTGKPVLQKERTWMGKAIVQEELSLDELMSQATEIQAK